MPKKLEPGIGLYYGFAARLPLSDPLFDHNAKLLGCLLFLEVINMTQTAPSGSEVDGDRYVVGASPTGLFSGRAKSIANRVDGAWEFYAPKKGFFLTNRVDGISYRYDGTNWVSASSAPAGTAGGDLSGTYPNPVVVKLQSNAVSNSSPLSGAVLIWNNTSHQWEPGTVSSAPTGAAGGDLSSTYPNPTVSKLDGVIVDNHSVAPTNGQALVYDLSTTKYKPTTLPDFIASGTTHAHGQVPDPGASAGTTKYLREDATWHTPPDNDTTYSDFVGSGASHAHGLVPDPPSSAGTTKFLREDASWAVPPGTGGGGGGGFSGVRATRNTDQSIPDNTTTYLLFTSENYDSASYHDTSSNTDKFIAPVTGTYTISVRAAFDTAGSATLRIIGLQLNGTTTIVEWRCVSLTIDLTYMHTYTEYALTAGDFVKAYVFHHIGSALAIKGVFAGLEPAFTMHLIN